MEPNIGYFGTLCFNFPIVGKNYHLAQPSGVSAFWMYMQVGKSFIFCQNNTSGSFAGTTSANPTKVTPHQNKVSKLVNKSTSLHYIYCIYCNNLFIYLMQTYCSFINFMQHQSPLTLDLRSERRNGNASDRSKRSRPRRIWHWRSCWPKLAYPGLV